jgi:AcrR family transcriptional regulator
MSSMTAAAEPGTEARAPLNRDRVLRAAVALADAGGLDSLSMRKLAQQLGVEAMSLYNHVRNKDDVLDGIIDVIVGEIDMQQPASTAWKPALRQRVMAARSVMLRHTWAPRVIETRSTMSPVLRRYMESLAAILRQGGFSLDLTHHTFHVLGSRILGFNQDLFDDTSQMDSSPEVAALMAREMADTYPYITEMATAISHEGGLGGCDDDTEFAFGLDLILDGLERLRDGATHAAPPAIPPPGHAAPLTPELARALDDLRKTDPKLLRQLRASVVELLDAALTTPPRGRRPR